jgi:malonate decarboxylase gamma subunit
MSESATSRGRIWFEALAGSTGKNPGYPASLLAADQKLGQERVTYLALAPDPESRFPRASHAEVGVEQGWFAAKFIRQIMEADKNGTKRPIITVVDSKSQAYGRREELAGIYLAAAAVIAAFAEARLAGHPFIALIVGRAVSGSFLTLCGQASELVAFNDPQVLVHAMYKDAAARITRRSVAELDKLGERIVPMAYDIGSFAKLGGLYKLLDVASPDAPTKATVAQVQSALLEAIAAARSGTRDLDKRLESEGARQLRQASLEVRRRMTEQWSAS